MSSGIIVLGMHRSGTSLVAEMLHRSGALGRVEGCLPADQWNARGYWELSSLVDFNTRLLGQVSADWMFPPSSKSDRRLAGLAHSLEYRKEAGALLAQMSSRENTSWFWKDPRLSLLLPFWQEIWSDVRYVICVRDPREVCLSLQERDGLSFEVSLALWQSYMLSILEWTRSFPCLFVNYSLVLRQPSEECRRLAQFLNQGDSSILEMQKAVDRQLQHCRSDSRPMGQMLSGAQTELFELLLELAHPSASQTDLDLARYARPITWRASLKKDLLLLRCRKFWSRTFGEAAPQTASDKYSEAWINAPQGGASSFYDFR